MTTISDEQLADILERIDRHGLTKSQLWPDRLDIVLVLRELQQRRAAAERAPRTPLREAADFVEQIRAGGMDTNYAYDWHFDLPHEEAVELAQQLWLAGYDYHRKGAAERAPTREEVDAKLRELQNAAENEGESRASAYHAGSYHRSSGECDDLIRDILDALFGPQP